MIKNPEKYLVTAGGRITCIRCKAQSSRTKLQCAKPSLKGKAVCGHHGGYSTGPRTKEGIQRIRKAHLKHGEATKEAREKQSAKNLMFCYLEDLMNHLPLMKGESKRVGRKPKNYVAYDLKTKEGLKMAILASKN